MNFGNLLHWALIFLVVAIVAGFLGFGGVAGTAMDGARLLFWVAIVLLLISLVFGFCSKVMRETASASYLKRTGRAPRALSLPLTDIGAKTESADIR